MQRTVVHGWQKTKHLAKIHKNTHFREACCQGCAFGHSKMSKCQQQSPECDGYDEELSEMKRGLAERKRMSEAGFSEWSRNL